MVVQLSAVCILNRKKLITEINSETNNVNSYIRSGGVKRDDCAKFWFKQINNYIIRSSWCFHLNFQQNELFSEIIYLQCL